MPKPRPHESKNCHCPECQLWDEGVADCEDTCGKEPYDRPCEHGYQWRCPYASGQAL